MELMIVGGDLYSLVVILLILFGFGFLLYWLTKKLLRKIFKEASAWKIKLLSGISAFILSPTIVIGSFALFAYVSMLNEPTASDEEFVKDYYRMIEEDFKVDLKPGMSKIDVISLFGETDTTQSVLVYDMSIPEAKEKYILEITFDMGRLKDFKRKR